MPSIPNNYLPGLEAALLSAFPSRIQLERMLHYELEKPLAAMPSAEALSEQIYIILRTAQTEGWTTELVAGARRANPGNERLLHVAQELEAGSGKQDPSASPPPPVMSEVDLELPSQELESIIQEAYAFLDLESWIAQSQRIVGQVCKISIQTNKGPSSGTGFLVGPDLVMTNYHVIEPVLRGEQGQTTVKGVSARVQDVTLIFDHKLQADGLTRNPGVKVTLASPVWLLDSSPVNDLDYALLRVAERPGDKRGWLMLPEYEQDIPEQMPLFIVQHPAGDTIKLALDKVLPPPWPKHRIRYTTNTKPGSSGSPCFNARWELVALHHIGDLSEPPTYNQGIPFTAIVKRLKHKAIWQELNQEPSVPVQVEQHDAAPTPITAPPRSSGMSGMSATRRRSLERQRDDLKAELEAAENQFAFTEAEADRLRIGRRVDYLIEQIDKLEAQLGEDGAASAAAAAQGGTESTSQPSTSPPSSEVQALIEGLNRHKLLNILLKLNDLEFRTLLLAFDRIEYDHLGGDNTGRKTLELVLWAERHNQFGDLIQVAHDLYPDLNWKV